MFARDPVLGEVMARISPTPRSQDWELCNSQVAWGQNIEKSRQSGQKCEIFFGHSLGGMI